MGMRHRSRTTAPIESTHTIHGKRYAGTTSNPEYHTEITSTASYFRSMKEVWSMDDVVTTDFKGRSARGEIFNNPMRRSVRQEHYPQPTPFYRGLLGSKMQSGVKVLTGDVWRGTYPMSVSELGNYLVPGEHPGFVAMVADLKNRAVTSAHASVGTSEMNLWATAGEARETVESITSILVRAFKIFRALRKADTRYLKREITWERLADRYMEARYAIRPLFYDAVGVQKAWETQVNIKRRQTFRGYASDVFEISDTIPYAGWNSYGTIERIGRCETKVRAGVLTDVEVSNMSVWGLGSVIDGAWELVPFSFIVDWFLNVGKTIAAWTPEMGVTKLSSWVVIETTALSRNRLVSIANYPSSSCNEDNSYYWSGEKSQVEVWKTRIPDPSRASWPSMNIRLDTLKLIDLALILDGFIYGTLKRRATATKE